MTDTKSEAVRLCIVEDQEIYRMVYRSIFPTDSPIDLLDISTNVDLKAIRDKISKLDPDVLLLGIKSLHQDMIEEVKELYTDFPEIGVVLFFVNYHSDGIKPLKKLAIRSRGGMAIFSKQSLERVNQLQQIIISVNEGHVIIDPALTSLLFAGRQCYPFLNGFTHREVEVMSLLAQGHTNLAIAEALCIDIRTVRHHINNMYSKLKADTDFTHRHPRVSAARLYLETIGELISEGSLEQELPSSDSSRY